MYETHLLLQQGAKKKYMKVVLKKNSRPSALAVNHWVFVKFGSLVTSTCIKLKKKETFLIT